MQRSIGNGYRNILLWMALWIVAPVHLEAQPYVDPVQIRYMYGWRDQKAYATPHTHAWIGADLPVSIGKNSFLLISPAFEEWQIDSAKKENIIPSLRSLSLPLGLILPLDPETWSLTLIPIVRWNGEKLFEKNTFQLGGVFLVGYAVKPHQKFRAGVYLNDEFFGLFVMPLLGVDWRLNENNYLFGVLPGRLTYEHQWSSRFFGGATLRAPTNSYRLSNGQFVRLSDIQATLFADFYAAKTLCLTLEAGWGMFRKIRTGLHDTHYLTETDWGDSPILKVDIAYRIRLAE